MSQSHTTGPWSVQVPPSSCLTCRFVNDERGRTVAKIGHMDYSCGQAEDIANAHLIAAAPELLQALRVAEATIERLNRHNSANGTLDVIRAAVAKAEGAS